MIKSFNFYKYMKYMKYIRICDIFDFKIYQKNSFFLLIKP